MEILSTVYNYILICIIDMKSISTPYSYVIIVTFSFTTKLIKSAITEFGMTFLISSTYDSIISIASLINLSFLPIFVFFGFYSLATNLLLSIFDIEAVILNIPSTLIVLFMILF